MTCKLHVTETRERSFTDSMNLMTIEFDILHLLLKEAQCQAEIKSHRLYLRNKSKFWETTKRCSTNHLLWLRKFWAI